MKINISKYGLLLLLGLSFIEGKAQTITSENNTLYFMENVAARQTFNTAFQPKSNLFVSLPVLGFTHAGLGNNSLALKDIVYNKDNKSIFFFHPDGDKRAFYNTLRNNTMVGGSFRTNLLAVGFRANSTAYWTISASTRFEGNIVAPKSFMELALFGTEKEKNNHYDLTKLNAEVMAFSDVSVAYSKKLGEKWTVGAKASVLLGHGHASIKNTDLSIAAGVDKWIVNGEGKFHNTFPGLTTGEKFNKVKFDNDVLLKNPINGFGGALNLGATYKPVSNLTLSAAINDLGAIRWSGKNATTSTYKINFETEGIDLSKENAEDEFLDELRDNLNVTDKEGAYFAYLSPKLNVGAEYGFFNNALSLGLLSKTQLYNNKLYEDLTISANTRATNWLDFSLSYSLLNGRASNLGAGFSIRAGFAQLFVAADYVPLSIAKYKYQKEDNTKQIKLPYETQGLNVSVGLNLVFGHSSDKDNDGVADKYDLCPNTPKGVAVDKNGCPIDSDNDGIPDYLDKCPNTPAEAIGYVDADGCLLDTDGDGIPDYLDKCPNTPAEAKGMVDANGCPLDTDGDGVADYLDKCPKVKGTKANNGCPEVKKVKEEVKEVIQKAVKGVQFATGKADIHKASYAVLDEIVKSLKANPDYKVEIQGHTDNTGGERRNIELSRQRAESVLKYLQNKGVSNSRMTAKGFGATRPIADNNTVEGRSKNRRADFVITFEEIK